MLWLLCYIIKTNRAAINESYAFWHQLLMVTKDVDQYADFLGVHASGM